MDGDSMRRHFHGKASGEVNGGGFRCAIGDLTSTDDQSGDRRHYDNASGVSRNHSADGGLRTQKDCLGINVEFLIPLLFRELCGWRR
jgi:hypothetical protein